MQKSLRSLLVATVAVLGLAACSDDDDNGPTAATPTALVRVVHASPDAPNVDVAVDGSIALANVPFPVFSGYLEVPSGTRNVQVRPTGSQTAVIEADLALATGTAYTVFATGLVADISAVVAVDDLVAPTAGNVKVRVVHGAPSAPNVDVYATAPGADINTATPVLTNVPFRGVSDYLTVPAGQYQFRVTPTGTKTVAIDLTVTLNTNSIRTVVARDNVGGGTPFALFLLPDLN
jgi:hypothetical protein